VRFRHLDIGTQRANTLQKEEGVMRKKIASVVIVAAVLAASVSAQASKRVAGNTEISLPSSTRLLMSKQNVQSTEVGVRVCISPVGKPMSVVLERSSGYYELDEKIASEIKNWRYAPALIDGVAVPHCTLVGFKYLLM
jgi:TonB family protein